MAKKRPAKPDEVATRFEDSLAELELIVAELESGKLGLSEALARYEQGARHLKACQHLLQRAERRIELLSGVDADGNPITQPLDDRELGTLEEKAAARGQRRTSGARMSPGRNVSRDDDIDEANRLF
ncbi:MAG: exodeoxyribonuclease VII small subunit [Pirellulales bacterium]